jgi:hypothetical protein
MSPNILSNSRCIVSFQAKNIVNYLRIIHRILAPGGIWINLGPLLWHFENNNTNDPSIELDLEELKALAHKIGFELSVSFWFPVFGWNSLMITPRTRGPLIPHTQAIREECWVMYIMPHSGRRKNYLRNVIQGNQHYHLA